MMNWKTASITFFFGLLLYGLMAMHASEPWQYANDDNGAWFSAIARTHQTAGLGATRGQDFFTSRETGERVPYLHHPPLPGLILAAAFSATGSDSPATARRTFALLHMLTFLVIARLAWKLWNPDRNPLLYAFVLAVTATLPMSTFYGKMPNHEVPGLLFFILGVLAWGFPEDARPARRTVLALAAWLPAVFASWHASICILAWLLVHVDRKRFLRVALSLTAVLSMIGLAVIHLLWANHWQSTPSQEGALGHWTLGGSGASLMDYLGFLQHAVGIGMGRYAYLPAGLALAWVGIAIRDQLRTRQSLSSQTRGLMGLSVGSVGYALLFPSAVSNHAYQGFYLIPFVALASSMALQRICGQKNNRSGAGFRSRWCPLLLLFLTCVTGVILSLQMVKKASPGAIKAVSGIQSQYQ